MSIFLKCSQSCRLIIHAVSLSSENIFCCANRLIHSGSILHSKAPKESSIKAYTTKKYVKFLDKIEQSFKTSLPEAHKLYKLFKDGTWELFADSKEYYNVYKKVRWGHPYSSFTCRQLHLYQQFPGDLIKSVPLVISFVVPFLQYLILPIAYYMYPKALLCRYFWSSEQAKQFTAQDLETRHKHHPNIINYLNTHSKEVNDDRLRNALLSLTNQLMKTDTDIDTNDILKLKPIFENLPFSLQHLHKRHKIHMWHLCKCMEVRNVAEEMDLMRHIDLAMQKEGVDSIDDALLKQIGLRRGVNSHAISNDLLKKYLKKWIHISANIDANHYSLLLHTPVLLNSQAYTYNSDDNSKDNINSSSNNNRSDLHSTKK